LQRRPRLYSSSGREWFLILGDRPSPIFTRECEKVNILTKKHGEKIVLILKEERIDAHNSGELKDLFLKVLEEEGGRDLVIDLDQVHFIDSFGLGALLSGLKNAGLRSSGFILAGLQPRVRSMFELTRLHRVFDIYPKLEEALSE